MGEDGREGWELNPRDVADVVLAEPDCQSERHKALGLDDGSIGDERADLRRRSPFRSRRSGADVLRAPKTDIRLAMRTGRHTPRGRRFCMNGGRLCLGGLAFGALLLALSSCTGGPGTEWTVLVLLDTTGKTQFAGKPEKDALEALQNDYERHDHVRPDFELQFVETAGDAEKALTKLERRVANDRHLLAVIGPTGSTPAIELAKFAERKRIPLLSLATSRRIVRDGDGDGELRRWVFKFAPDTGNAARPIGTQIRRSGKDLGAVVHSQDEFGREGAAALVDWWKDHGATHGDADRCPKSGSRSGKCFPLKPFEEQGAEKQIAELMAKLECQKGCADEAVVIWSTSGGDEMVTALRREGFDGSIYLTLASATSDFIENAGYDAEGTIVIGSPVVLASESLDADRSRADETVLRFQRFWKERVGGAPSQFGAIARDAYVMLAYAVEEANLSQNATDIESARELVRQRLERVVPSERTDASQPADEGVFEPPMVGVTGTFRFTAEDHSGPREGAYELLTVRNGRFIRLAQAGRGSER